MTNAEFLLVEALECKGALSVALLLAVARECRCIKNGSQNTRERTWGGLVLTRQPTCYQCLLSRMHSRRCESCHGTDYVLRAVPTEEPASLKKRRDYCERYLWVREELPVNHSEWYRHDLLRAIRSASPERVLAVTRRAL